MDLALNNLQRLICHKTKPNQNKPNHLNITILDITVFFINKNLVLPIALPFNGIFACLFIEFLNSRPFIVYNTLRLSLSPFKDALLLVYYLYVHEIITTKITDKLNKSEPTVDFTNEQETNTTLLFFCF